LTRFIEVSRPGIAMPCRCDQPKAARRVENAMNRIFALLILLLSAPAAFAVPRPVELHQRLSLPAEGQGGPQVKVAALTLDACGGGFDEDLIRFLIERRIAATIFATKRWIDRNPRGVSLLTAHPALFQIEDHGAEHVPAVIGAGRRVYGILGEPDVAHLEREIIEGARAIERVNGSAPRWYRGATAVYDAAAIDVIKSLGYRIAGFSVNADAGATLRRGAIVARLKSARSGEIIIAHMNKPASDTAEGLAEGLTWMIAQGFRFVTLNAMAVRDLPA
jgi:peptidoglycan/xylan/chitin deacetylase (PgdA/CDA1 family)